MGSCFEKGYVNSSRQLRTGPTNETTSDHLPFSLPVPWPLRDPTLPKEKNTPPRRSLSLSCLGRLVRKLELANSDLEELLQMVQQVKRRARATRDELTEQNRALAGMTSGVNGAARAVAHQTDRLKSC